MRKIILLIISLSFFVTIDVFAASGYVVINDTVNIRKGPGTNYDKIATGKNGETYDLSNLEIIADEAHNGECDEGWYNINYNNSSAYICSLYATKYEYQEVEDDKPATSECEKEMEAAGFPSSYWNGLCTLKAKHPTWQFKALKTFLDFKTVVEKESSCGKSYIATDRADYKDTSCKNQYTKTWYPASQKAVAYYMDPRNWLTEKYIFQFEYLKYEKNMSNEYPNTVTQIIKNAAFYNYHTKKGNDLGKIVNEAGSNTDVSPVFLASRMLQELGTGDSLYNLYSGEYTGSNNAYKGYYNFFNYGVTDSCATTSGTSICGLTYAKNNGWNSPLNAISGASSSLSKSYIAAGQYTTYLQKYNVVPVETSKLYIHQYMTNVAAPSSESSISYNSYNKLNLLNLAFVFYIPVYNNMDNTITNQSNGATGEESSKNPSEYEFSSIVTLAGYRYDNGYISKIDANTKVEDFIGSLESISGTDVEIIDAQGKAITSGNIGTGAKVKIKNAQGEKTLTVIVHGDTSGDGVINALDLLQVQKNILGTYKLNDANNLAGDTSGDGKINALDLLQVQKSILGTYKIAQ